MIKTWILLLLLFFNGFLLLPFWRNIFWGIIIAVSVWRINATLRKILKYPALSALFLTAGFFLLVLALIVPAFVKIYFEASDLVVFIKNQDWAQLIGKIPSKITLFGYTLPIPFDELKNAVVSISSAVFPFLIQLFSNAAAAVGNSLVTAVFVFFFLKDGDKAVKLLNQLIEKFFGTSVDLTFIEHAIRGVTLSYIFVALIQAGISCLGLYAFGVKYILILSFLMFILAITPAGPVVLYLPLSVILMFDDFYRGLGLLFWHLIFVSLADNVLRPMLVAQSFKVSDWLLMFITLGGLYFFGFVGLFIAPILLAVSFHLLENSTNTSKDV